jgi:hypothetical protein
VLDVWRGDVRSPDTVGSAIRELGGRLRHVGMGKRAASAIRGQNGCYGLYLRWGD